MHEKELNLIPTDIMERETLRGRVRFWVFVSIVCLMFLIVANILIRMAYSSVSRDIARLEAISGELSKELLELRQLDTREGRMMAIKERIRHLSRRGPTIEVFGAIDQAINDNITLTHLEAKYSYPPLADDSSGTQSVPHGGEGEGGGGYFRTGSSASNLKGQVLSENTVIFQGTAQSYSDIASMLARLSRHPLFSAVNLRYSKTSEYESGKNIMFEVECRLKEATGNR